MVKIKKIKALMVENDYNQSLLAKALNITEKTMSRRFKMGDFTLEEVSKIRDLLKIDNDTLLKIFLDN